MTTFNKLATPAMGKQGLGLAPNGERKIGDHPETLMKRADAAEKALTSARTPEEKLRAEKEARDVILALERSAADQRAHAVIKGAQAMSPREFLEESR